jgi:hypothetical protein
MNVELPNNGDCHIPAVIRQHQVNPKAMRAIDALEILPVFDCLDFLVSQTAAAIIPTKSNIMAMKESSGSPNFPLNMRRLYLHGPGTCRVGALKSHGTNRFAYTGFSGAKRQRGSGLL